MHRADLLRVLADKFGNAGVNTSARFIGFDQDSNYVTANFADGRQHHCDFLIGADGLHSIVRQQLIGDGLPRYAGYTCWRGMAEYEGKSLPPGLGFEAWGRGARFAIQHCGAGRVFWYATRNAPEGSLDGPNGRKQDVVDLFGNWHDPITSVIAATNDGSILKNDIVDRKPIKQWGQGRITLLGDAAHPTTPNFGQGACQAMEDAIVLANCIDQAQEIVTALRNYEARRRERTAYVTKTSRQFGAFTQLENPILCGLRNTLIRTGMFRRTGIKQFERMLDFEMPTRS